VCNSSSNLRRLASANALNTASTRSLYATFWLHVKPALYLGTSADVNEPGKIIGA
jgi:hypothetical protein